MNKINWNEVVDVPTHWSNHQKLFYKISYDGQRLYVFDDGIWKKSAHSIDGFHKYYEVVENPNLHSEMMIFLNAGQHHPLKIWLALESGRGARLAKFLGVSACMVSGMSTGKKEIPIDKLQSISDYTNIHPKYLRRDIAAIFNCNFDDDVTIKASELNRLKVWDRG